jgi:hypothetical protein
MTKPKTNRPSSPVFQLLQSNERARADIEALLGLNFQRFIEAFKGEEDLVAAPSPAHLRVASLAAAAGLKLDTVWSGLSVVDWICNNKIDADILVADLSEIGLIKQDDVESRRRSFKQLIDAFQPAFARRKMLASTMGTFHGIQTACDLRAVEIEAESGDPGSAKVLTFTPVCIVRIHNDEGDVLTFQCTSADLDEIVEECQDAKKLLGDSQRRIG